MRQVVIACAFLALLAHTYAVSVPTHRKLLTLNSPNEAQYKPHSDHASAQLAANNDAIVNTQLAINTAVESGAGRTATESATATGADEAFAASQATKHCGWYSKAFNGC